MSKIVDNVKRLKKFFHLSCKNKKVKNCELLSSNKALERFGLVGLEHKEDLLTMMAKIEYSYGRDFEYTKEQMSTLKVGLAEVYRFFTSCGQEWDQYEIEQAQNKLNPHGSEPINQ